MLQDLKIEIPQLEPDPVLLAQLSQLSASSVASRREGRVRALVAGATVLVLASFSWLTGTLPGVASPFDGVRDQRPAPHAPRTSPGSDASEAADEDSLPPGQVRTHEDNGNHTGLNKPNHHDNGNHTGLNDAQQDNGNHTGQTKPHTNQGQHAGQTKPHTDQGQHAGPTQPRPPQPTSTTDDTATGSGNGTGRQR